MCAQIILVRHGESQWNQENRFTGWEDVDLTHKGLQQARAAARLLRAQRIHCAYSSVLKRSIRTLWAILDELDTLYVPFITTWLLNERHYGVLQGMQKTEAVRQYGRNSVRLWRRSYRHAPPARIFSPKGQQYEAAYQNIPLEGRPRTESLEDTCRRTTHFFNTTLLPNLCAAKNALITAHGNSIRALIKTIESLSDEDIIHIEVPHATPIVYTFSGQKMRNKTILT